MNHRSLKKSESGEIPKEWTVSTLRQVVASYRNGIYKRPEFYGRGYPSVRMYNIENGQVNTNDAVLLEATDEELEEYGLAAGDILVNRVNSAELVGKAGIVPEGLGPVTFESKNIRVRLRENICDPNFLAWYMTTDLWYHQIRARVKRAISQATINQEDLDKILIPLPPLLEQREISQVLNTLRSAIESIEKNIDAANALKMRLISEFLQIVS
jgi:type I restriction enzyme, S subunit